ncbi:hypothetical protein AB0M87_32095 [Streptomyces sp. NPDC051320]|uniref:hypothetical protein n=1 Tax=Streptomyces sp. NPDC051320 TaxID=3154644 RepID=UPI0034359361
MPAARFSDPAYLAGRIHRDLLPLHRKAITSARNRAADRAAQEERRAQLIKNLSATAPGEQAPEELARYRPWDETSVGRVRVEVDPDSAGNTLHAAGLSVAESTAALLALLSRPGWDHHLPAPDAPAPREGHTAAHEQH